MHMIIRVARFSLVMLVVCYTHQYKKPKENITLYLQKAECKE